MIRKTEIKIGIQEVQVLHGGGVGKHAICEAGNTVEHGKRVPHTAFAFLGYNMQTGLLGYHAFLRSYALQVLYYIICCNAFEIEYLATTEDGGQDLVLLGSSQDKNGIRRRFF